MQMHKIQKASHLHFTAQLMLSLFLLPFSSHLKVKESMVSVLALALHEREGLRLGRKILNADGFIFWSLLPFFPPRYLVHTEC